MKKAKTMHEHVANTVRDRIAYGVYPADQLLPPERLLCAEFDCSRHTIREALKALVAERLMVRTAGRGTIVARPIASTGAWGLQSISDLMGEFTGENPTSQWVVLKKGVVSARTEPHVAELFGLRETGSMYAIQRVINLESGPAAFNRLFTLVNYATRIPKEEVGIGPLIDQIEKYCRISAFRTRQVASAVEAEGEIAKILGVRKGAALLKLRRTYLDRDDQPIEYTEMIARPDRYEQSVDFFNREKPTGKAKSRARPAPTKA